MTFIDSHCHLPDLQHADELDKIIRDANDRDVHGFIAIGTSLKENEKTIKIAEKIGSVYAGIGIYPHEQMEDKVPDLMARLEEQARSSKKVVAIGECGIDITERKNQRPLSSQEELFEAQVELAKKLALPLIIHNRNGDEIILKVLLRNPGITGVVHCFDSTWATAQNFIRLGFYLSFSGLITYPSRKEVLETVLKIPSDKYLLETDSPYLLPEPERSISRGSLAKIKNEPKYARITAQKVAEVRQISLEEVAQQTSDNTRRLFGLQ